MLIVCPFYFLLQFLFKKYLEYEKSLGDEERIEYVKKKAMDYVESTLAWYNHALRREISLFNFLVLDAKARVGRLHTSPGMQFSLLTTMKVSSVWCIMKGNESLLSLTFWHLKLIIGKHNEYLFMMRHCCCCSLFSLHVQLKRFILN